MDAYAQSLLVDAWDEFRGQEPPLPPETSLRERALARAVTQLGVKESPAGSNQTPYTKWYGMVGPWCAMFCTWCLRAGGRQSPSFKQGVSYAYVPYIVSDARAGRNGLSVTSSPLPGDLVCYDWYYDGTFDHVGLFERWKGSPAGSTRSRATRAPARTTGRRPGAAPATVDVGAGDGVRPGEGAVTWPLDLTTIPDEALLTINSLEILGIIYLAVAVSKLRERIARMEGKTEQKERGAGRGD